MEYLYFLQLKYNFILYKTLGIPYLNVNKAAGAHPVGPNTAHKVAVIVCYSNVQNYCISLVGNIYK